MVEEVFASMQGLLDSQTQKHHSALERLWKNKGKANYSDASGRREPCDCQIPAQGRLVFSLLFVLYLLNYAPQPCTSCSCSVLGEIPFSIEICFSGQQQTCKERCWFKEEMTFFTGINLNQKRSCKGPCSLSKIETSELLFELFKAQMKLEFENFRDYFSQPFILGLQFQSCLASGLRFL